MPLLKGFFVLWRSVYLLIYANYCRLPGAAKGKSSCNDCGYTGLVVELVNLRIGRVKLDGCMDLATGVGI